jgi:hypothetical protein
MPRIVPSQVVKFIDKLFPQSGGAETLGKGNAGQLRAIVNLIEGIPDELLTMDSDSFAGLVCSVAYIRQTLESWSADRDYQSKLLPIPGFPNETAVTLVRKALAKCPDEAPAPSTAELNFITDAALRANLRNDIGAVNRALSNGEWKAATVLAGSAAEAMLLWALEQRPPEEITSAIAAARASGDLATKPDPNLDRWNLHEYIEVAANLKVIKPNTAKQTRLAKDFRNFIHPGVAQRLGEKCDRATTLSAVAGMEHVVRDLTP